MGGNSTKTCLEKKQRKWNQGRISKIASLQTKTLKNLENLEALQNSWAALNQRREAMGVGPTRRNQENEERSWE